MEFEKSKTNGLYICPKCRRSLWKAEESVKKHAAKCQGRSSGGTSRKSKKIETTPVDDIAKKIKELKSDIKVIENAQANSNNKNEKKRLSNQKYLLNKKIKELENGQ